MATYAVKATDIDRKWFDVDATGRVLGRLAANIAYVLRGKHKVMYSPSLDNGDFVVVTNAGKIKITGTKLEDKDYYHHTGYPGGLRHTTPRKVLETHPDRILRMAVKGMLPKGPLGRKMLKKLKIYVGSDHPHSAQQPTPITAVTKGL